MIILQHQVAILIGLTVMSVGGVMWFRRCRFRGKLQQTASKALNRSIVEISWNKSFECGHRTIDAQHRRLFGIRNELIDAVLTKKPKYDVESLLHELVDHVEHHFSEEEAVLAETGYPISNEHGKIHRTLLAKAKNLRDRHRTGEIIISEIVSFVTDDVIINHIIQEDRKFVTRWNADVNQPVEKISRENLQIATQGKENREGADTVLMMFRKDPEPSNITGLTVPILDKLTPNKVLLNTYPHVWQRICVFAVEPKHLQKYLMSLSLQDGAEKRADFSKGALQEIVAISKENDGLLANPVSYWKTGILNA